MIIYEVNLKILTSIFDDYMHWLIPHVKEMLTFKGFKNARYLAENPAQEENFTKITMQYEIESMDDLQHYFDNYAHHRREDGIRQFPDQFSATRRIFEVKKLL